MCLHSSKKAGVAVRGEEPERGGNEGPDDEGRPRRYADLGLIDNEMETLGRFQAEE